MKRFWLVGFMRAIVIWDITATIRCLDQGNYFSAICLVLAGGMLWNLAESWQVREKDDTDLGIEESGETQPKEPGR